MNRRCTAASCRNVLAGDHGDASRGGGTRLNRAFGLPSPIAPPCNGKTQGSSTYSLLFPTQDTQEALAGTVGMV